MSGRRVLQTGQIPADSIVPIRIRVGYRAEQLVRIYPPLLAMALVLMLATALACRHGFAHLHRSIFILGTTLWLGAVWRLDATEPIRILLAGTPLAILASTALAFLTPLVSVAAGSALDNRPRAGSTPGSRFENFFWAAGYSCFRWQPVSQPFHSWLRRGGNGWRALVDNGGGQRLFVPPPHPDHGWQYDPAIVRRRAE
jgi:hypothetical protein